jgi:hypothetical protein
MSETFSATFSGPDLRALSRALLDAAPYAKGRPSQLRVKLNDVEVTDDWRERLLAPVVDGLTVVWGRGQQIGRNPGAVSASFPSVALEPAAVLEAVASLPFELAVVPPVHVWSDDYFAPAIGADHALLGWAAILKGAGHERHLVSRRWIEHGPWRTVRGPNDTTLVQFHQLEIDESASMTQAQAAHDWFVAGFLRTPHRYKQDVAGVYTADDGLLRVVVNDRKVTDAELLDACAARRDRKDDRDRPIRNVAYVFTDEAAAKANLERLWLRGLECRALVKGNELRLDDRYSLAAGKAPW